MHCLYECLYMGYIVTTINIVWWYFTTLKLIKHHKWYHSLKLPNLFHNQSIFVINLEYSWHIWKVCIGWIYNDFQSLSHVIGILFSLAIFFSNCSFLYNMELLVMVLTLFRLGQVTPIISFSYFFKPPKFPRTRRFIFIDKRQHQQIGKKNILL